MENSGEVVVHCIIARCFQHLKMANVVIMIIAISKKKSYPVESKKKSFFKLSNYPKKNFDFSLKLVVLIQYGFPLIHWTIIIVIILSVVIIRRCRSNEKNDLESATSESLEIEEQHEEKMLYSAKKLTFSDSKPNFTDIKQNNNNNNKEPSLFETVV